MIGGLAYNMKFNRSLFHSPASFTRLAELVLTFLRRGGFETQINVVDAEALRRAQAAGIMHIYRAGESPTRHGVAVANGWDNAKAQLASELGWAQATEIAPANPGDPDPVPSEFRVR